MRKFPEINQYRHTVESIQRKATFIGLAEDGSPRYDDQRPKPVLVFSGTTKLHGTNGGIKFDLASGSVLAQSRERELTVDYDNHGFCLWSQSASGSQVLQKLRDIVVQHWTTPASVSVHAFGEWCGPTVNGKTAIGQLSDRWVVFSILVTDEAGAEVWLEPKDVAQAFYADGSSRPADFCFISEFKQWQLSVDFNDPASMLDTLEALTLEVELSCPVAEALGGAAGGLGEGIVWVNQDPKWGRHVFKTKGTKHKGTRGARLVTIAPEVLASQEAFVQAVLTESRLEQGYDILVARDGKLSTDNLGEFLRWIGTDVLKEEADTLKASGLDRKDVMGAINRRAKVWVTPRLAKV